MSADDGEAHDVLAQRVARVDAMSYEDLRALIPETRPRGYVGTCCMTEETVAPSGETYQVVVEAWWDDEEAGTIRVLVAVDGGPIPPTRPLADDLLVSRPAVAG